MAFKPACQESSHFFLPLSFLNLSSFSKLSVFVWNSETVSLLPEEWMRIYSSNQMWWQWERVWSGAGKPCVRRKEGRKRSARVCVERVFRAREREHGSFWVLYVHQLWERACLLVCVRSQSPFTSNWCDDLWWFNSLAEAVDIWSQLENKRGKRGREESHTDVFKSV